MSELTSIFPSCVDFSDSQDQGGSREALCIHARTENVWAGPTRRRNDDTGGFNRRQVYLILDQHKAQGTLKTEKRL